MSFCGVGGKKIITSQGKKRKREGKSERKRRKKRKRERKRGKREGKRKKKEKYGFELTQENLCEEKIIFCPQGERISYFFSKGKEYHKFSPNSIY